MSTVGFLFGLGLLRSLVRDRDIGTSSSSLRLMTAWLQADFTGAESSSIKMMESVMMERTRVRLHVKSTRPSVSGMLGNIKLFYGKRFYSGVRRGARCSTFSKSEMTPKLAPI